MQILKILLFIFLIHCCVGQQKKCRNCGQRRSDLSLEQMRHLRYEYFKNQILKKLHLTKAPKTNLPKPPLKTILMIAEMAENETSLETDDQIKTESIVIYPKNENQTCYENTSNPCHRFEYDLPDSLPLENFVSAEVWFYKDQIRHAKVHQVITDYSRNLTSTVQLDNVQTEKNAWDKYNVRIDTVRSNTTVESLLVIEVMIENVETASGNATVIFEDKPFLIIRTDVSEGVSRRRRNTNNCLDSYQLHCCKEDFYLNFSEIGWDDWILHPDGYQPNFCRGSCFNEFSNTRFYHSTVLLSYIRDNKEMAQEIGLNMCCTPSVMSSVAIIYRNDEGYIFHKNIENMKVESCDCA